MVASTPGSVFVTVTIFAALTFGLLLPFTLSVPFVVFHGISEACTNSGVKTFTERLSNWSGSQGYCIEIGDGEWDSWTMPLLEQTAIACAKIKEISELNDGFNIVGLSQGSMIARGVIELCDGAPPVKNFISLAGPLAGIASIPLCESGIICILVDYLAELEVYSSYVQEHLAPSGYYKIPTDLSAYLSGCKFLPKINNEIISERNSTYKARFASLEQLVLIMFDGDTVLIPKETSWFGYYPAGSYKTVLPAQETLLYVEDWIGLRSLDEAGKVKFVNVSGEHLKITETDVKNYVVPYLEDKTSSLQTAKDSSYSLLLSIRNFFTKLTGHTADQLPRCIQ